ncbi:MetQ/NlpA family ABC transporter substrate-binding protein [Campylobacter upsaliensis]|uniref:D-methionine ABC superfamily ATP binding cassette transporter, binding protein n=2 Tax=Campylobacter upsaliensis TaxID=28080 RepID=A0A828QYL5_CAMUP|nr:MetQ/NlpA family ABC transporter substrate-binding protein [Campylobacter upsaliensis]EAB5281194.1 MetQ/NlpA family ABC transporter substrate-binding protein [Campylobacter upsaliensis]EAH5552424.1 MetQ/NlpA family ABC transporter substrate-binding protein [Campylobacter upsaliensis]EAH5886009.1 MetQ/NlpA family ABC transporter substrate-binding protein [Campylobacter upsaliensis]EAH5903051.1 MetQ/NlpA family ABC transporter substrate-binding protein [Campylobacter upsaliensis]EAH5976585.1 
MNIKTLLLASLVGFTLNLNAAEKIVVAATPVPHAEILNQAKEDLEKEGYTLEVKEFTDYVLPNLATDNGEVDANFFQHTPYLEEFNKSKGTKLVKVANIHIEPMAVYSKKYKNFNELKDGAKIAVPNDPTNESRALDIIAKTGLVSFNDKALKTPIDITQNPKNIKFIELKAAQLPRALSDVDVAVINSNYALLANLNPVKDSIFIEDKDSPYANILVVKEGKEQDPKIKALTKALQSEKIKKFIEEKYNGAVIPAF